MRSVLPAALTALAFLASACVQPAHTVQKSRELAYLEVTGTGSRLHRCGETYTLTGFSLHNVDEAFPAGSRAAELGRSAETHAAWGTGLSILAAGLSTAALILVVTADYNSTTNVPDQAVAGLGLALGALIPASIATGQTISAQTRLLDAVNTYNEEAFANPADPCAGLGQ